MTSELYPEVRKYLENYRTQFVDLHTVPAAGILDKCDEAFYKDRWRDQTRQRRNFMDENELLHSTYLKGMLKVVYGRTEHERDEMISLIDELKTEPSIELIRSNVEPHILIKGKYLLLSNVLPDCEAMLVKNEEICEVKFVADRKFFIDASLSQTYWHGKSVTIKSPIIECVFETGIGWDLSGTDTQEQAPPAYNGRPGSENGWNGDPGKNGENGGNVTMYSNEYLGLERLTVRTYGGKGGTGQNGGAGHDGANGVDGVQFSEQKLFEVFPDVPDVVAYNVNANALYTEVDLDGFDREGRPTGNGFLPNRTMYYSGILHARYIFEYCYSQWALGCSSYVIVKGSKAEKGRPGGKGGDGGNGGLGGKGGVVKFHNQFGTEEKEIDIIVESNDGRPGDDGEKGKPGKGGKDGRDGADICFIKKNVFSWSKIYQNGFFEFGDSEESRSDSVWCNKHKKYRFVKVILQ